MQEGKRVFLFNCHLSLEYMAQLKEVLYLLDKTIHSDFLRGPEGVPIKSSARECITSRARSKM